MPWNAAQSTNTALPDSVARLSCNKCGCRGRLGTVGLVWEAPAEFWAVQQVYTNTHGGHWGYSECLQTWSVSSGKPELSLWLLSTHALKWFYLLLLRIFYLQLKSKVCKIPKNTLFFLLSHYLERKERNFEIFNALFHPNLVIEKF